MPTTLGILAMCFTLMQYDYKKNDVLDGALVALRLWPIAAGVHLSHIFWEGTSFRLWLMYQSELAFQLALAGAIASVTLFL